MDACLQAVVLLATPSLLTNLHVHLPPRCRCGYGLTTTDDTSIKDTEASCNKLAPGFGFNAATAQIERCPIGTFSAGQLATTTVCSTCQSQYASTTTASTGATSRLNCTCKRQRWCWLRAAAVAPTAPGQG